MAIRIDPPTKIICCALTRGAMLAGATPAGDVR